jgi:hypothetical protein
MSIIVYSQICSAHHLSFEFKKRSVTLAIHVSNTLRNDCQNKLKPNPQFPYKAECLLSRIVRLSTPQLLCKYPYCYKLGLQSAFYNNFPKGANSMKY